MAKKKFSHDEDDNVGQLHVNGYHVTNSHSNARAVQLTSGQSGMQGRGTLDKSETGVDQRKTVGRLRPSASFNPIENVYIQQQQPRSRPVTGIAGLFNRKFKKSWSGSESCNSSSEGANSDTCDSGDGHRKKKSEKNATFLRRRATTNDLDAPEIDRSFIVPRVTPITSEAELVGRRRSLPKKKALTKYSTEHDTISTASENGSRPDGSTREQLKTRPDGSTTSKQPLRGRASDRASSAKNADRTMVNDIFQATTVYRTGSGSILVQTERSETDDLGHVGRSQLVGGALHVSQRKGSPRRVRKETTETAVKLYPKYKPDALMRGQFWMNGHGASRAGSSDTEVKTARLPTISTAYVNMDAYRSLEPERGHRKSSRSAVGTAGGSARRLQDRHAPVDSSNAEEPKHTGNNFVGGHYPKIMTPQTLIADLQNADAVDNVTDPGGKITRSRTLASPNSAADVYRSKSPNFAKLTTLPNSGRRHRHLSGNDAGRHRSASKHNRTSVVINDRQSKSADDLSPRVSRRDDGRVADDVTAIANQQLQPALMRTVTIHVTGAKDADQRGQFDHSREKAKQEKANGDAQSGRATGSISTSVPNLKKYGFRDLMDFADGDNVYRPRNGNLPRADSTDSLLRKDQFDFLSERNDKEQRDTIDSVYWKGDTAKSETGLTVDMVLKSFTAASSVNTVASLEMLMLSDGGGSECSSTSDPPTLKYETRSSSTDGNRWRDDTGSQHSYNSAAVRRRPLIGSTERRRFVRRNGQRHSATDDLFGRFPEQDDGPTVREAPCIRSSTYGIQFAVPTEAAPAIAEQQHKILPVNCPIVQPTVVHDYAEVISFFRRDVDDGGRLLVSEAGMTGTWQWPSGGRVGAGDDHNGKIASEWPDVNFVGRAVFHFRSVSPCIENGKISTLPIDIFRMVDGSMAPAGSRRLARRTAPSVNYVPATTSSNWRDNDDDGIIGYRRYLVTGSRPSTKKIDIANGTSSSYSSGSSWTSGRFWSSVWPFASDDDQGSAKNSLRRSVNREYSRSFVPRAGFKDADDQLLDKRWKLGISFCDYFAGMLLGMVTVLIISYLQCGD